MQGHKDAATIQASSKASGSQAILVFLPGAGEIDRLARQLRSSTQLKRAAEGLGFLILPLHGSLPPDHQVQTEPDVTLFRPLAGPSILKGLSSAAQCAYAVHHQLVANVFKPQCWFTQLQGCMHTCEQKTCCGSIWQGPEPKYSVKAVASDAQLALGLSGA